MTDLAEIRRQAERILAEYDPQQPTTERVLFRMVMALCDHIEQGRMDSVELSERVGA